MSNPSIDHRSSGGTSYTGRDAVNLYRAKTLVVALRMYARSGMIPSRNVTPARMLVLASEYTGKTYKRGEHAQAAEDVMTWVNTMAVAIPTTVDGKAV